MLEIYRLGICYVYKDDYLRAEVRGNGVLVLKIYRCVYSMNGVRSIFKTNIDANEYQNYLRGF